MCVDCGVVVQNLLEVVAAIAQVFFLQCTTGRVKLSVVFVEHFSAAIFIYVISTVDGQCQTFHEGEICKTTQREGITFLVAVVEQVVLQWVGIVEEVT